MKFIHCADLHLDSKIETLPAEKSKIRREEVLRSFERLCDYASENSITAIIIAGDMFDTARVTIRTRERVINAIKNNSSVDFLYLAGNHDEESFISSIESLPSNLKIFNEEWTAFRYGNVLINGIKFSNSNFATAYDSIKLNADDVNILVMHGQIADYKGEEKSEVVSLPRFKDKNVDYLALGHYHEYSEGEIDARGKYVYSGCLDGRGFDELGDKGFVLIDVNDTQLNHKFIKFSSRNFSVFEYDLSGKTDWISAKNEIISLLGAKIPSNNLVKVVLKGERSIDFDVDVEGLSYRLNEEFFFAKVYDKTQIMISEKDYALDKSVRGEFVRAVWESDLSAEMKSKVLTCGLNALKGEDL